MIYTIYMASTAPTTVPSPVPACIPPRDLNLAVKKLRSFFLMKGWQSTYTE